MAGVPDMAVLVVTVDMACVRRERRGIHQLDEEEAVRREHQVTLGGGMRCEIVGSQLYLG